MRENFGGGRKTYNYFDSIYRCLDLTTLTISCNFPILPIFIDFETISIEDRVRDCTDELIAAGEPYLKCFIVSRCETLLYCQKSLLDSVDILLEGLGVDIECRDCACVELVGQVF